MKLNRLKCGLTQGELAEGIISVSYLSKIEHNQIFPSEEVYNLIFKRLGIDIEEELQLNDFVLEKKCRTWFHALLLGSEKDRLSYLYEDIKKPFSRAFIHEYGSSVLRKGR
ncbi:helix-turn-helix domain-containing protein [Lentibacillus sp. Marseille-P4043]|uniref:helix-turn-helix domain-containing protein n=1 Tax=Lentibacillus sp. Marseille-P4043 TaxID=2040293 RepID=UPI00227754D7|nr:helix-turn-helix transcriptional regulator [Lentibacillus sp. Marseille-P4043]